MKKYIQIYSEDENRAMIFGQHIIDSMFENKKISEKLRVYQVRLVDNKCYGDCLYRVYMKS